MPLSQVQIPKQILTPILKKSLEVLLLPLMDLTKTIEQELENNPLLEIVEPVPSESIEKIAEDFNKRLEQETTLQSAETNFAPEDLPAERPLKQEQTLEDELLQQLKCEFSDPIDLQIGEFILGNINEDGYLTISCPEISQALQIPDINRIERVLQIIQSFEPYGIAARDLKECLTIQARFHLNGQSPLVEQIVREFLPEVAKKKYSEIAKKLKVSVDKIRQAVTLLAALEPRPARNYRAIRANIYIKPDVSIRNATEDIYVVHVSREGLPKLGINASYRTMLKDPGLKPDEKQFIREKLTNAINFIRSVEQRGQTLRRITEFIVQKQKDFFKNGHLALVPMSLKDVAMALGRNESTISRAINDKYVETPQGLYPFKFFFSQSVNGHPSHGLENNSAGPVSNRSVKEEMRSLIGEEDRSTPLTDQDIQKHFEEHGIKIARRTIAKYRTGLKILPGNLRKINK